MVSVFMARHSLTWSVLGLEWLPGVVYSTAHHVYRFVKTAAQQKALVNYLRYPFAIFLLLQRVLSC